MMKLGYKTDNISSKLSRLRDEVSNSMLHSGRISESHRQRSRFRLLLEQRETIHLDADLISLASRISKLALGTIAPP